MSLTNARMRVAKPGLKPDKPSDGRGLYVAVFPNGSKLWRWKHRFAGKEKRLVRQALLQLRYGSIAITVHEDRIVQIDVTEKKRVTIA